MPTCPDCGRETDRPARCAGCEMVERALTPPGVRTITSSRARTPVTVPIREPIVTAGHHEPAGHHATGGQPERRARVWIVLALGLALGFAAGATFAWRAFAREPVGASVEQPSVSTERPQQPSGAGRR